MQIVPNPLLPDRLSLFLTYSGLTFCCSNSRIQYTFPNKRRIELVCFKNGDDSLNLATEKPKKSKVELAEIATRLGPCA